MSLSCFPRRTFHHEYCFGSMGLGAGSEAHESASSSAAVMIWFIVDSVVDCEDEGWADEDEVVEVEVGTD